MELPRWPFTVRRMIIAMSGPNRQVNLAFW